MRIIYYTEVNIICIIINMLILVNISRVKQKQRDQYYFFILQILTIVLCGSDLVAAVLRGQMFLGARLLLWISNMTYCIAITVISYFWMRYVMIRLGKTPRIVDAYLLAIPVVLITVCMLTTPFHGYMFTLDAQNLYARGSGLSIHWVVNLFYLMTPTLMTAKQIICSKNKTDRHNLYPLLLFVIFPFAGSVIQILIYGTTVIQAGIAVAVLMVGIQQQNAQISLDELTGLNNRRQMNKFLASKMAERKKNGTIFCMMIDIDHFKRINDIYGHLIGDHAIVEVADILKSVASHQKNSVFIARYGGDEFVLIGYGQSVGMAKAVEACIQSSVSERNQEPERTYQLALSIGFEEGTIDAYENADELLKRADYAMYEEKMRKKTGRI